MRSFTCIGCGIKTYKESRICALCDNGITQIYEELLDSFKHEEEEDLLNAVLLIESDGRKIPERRRHFRYDFPFTTIEYMLNPDSHYGIFIGFVLDISGSGLCLKTPNHLREGEKIIIKSLLFTSSKRAVVRWIQPLDDTYYKVGLEFPDK